MNTEEDWKREREENRPCRYCNGRGWVIDRNAPSGGDPCGCDEPQEEDDTQVGTQPGLPGEVKQSPANQEQGQSE